MQPSALKKVVLQCRNREDTRAGFLASAELDADPLNLLTPSGQKAELAQAELLAIYFVRDFAGPGVPNLTGVRAAARLPGLWVRVRGRGVRWEGILASQLLELECGIWLTPLHPGSTCERVWIPRRVVEKVEPVEVIRPARRRRTGVGRRRATASPQFELFHENSEETA